MIDTSRINSFTKKCTFLSKFYYQEELESTNDYAKSIAETNILVLTDNQTKGKGRLGRTWESEKNSNLTFSIKLRLNLEANDIQCINYFFTYYTAKVIGNYISQHSSLQEHAVNVRWPNDIFVDGKKISGILIENLNNKKDFIIGIGINVNQIRFETEYEYKTTSISNVIGRKCDINNVLTNLLTVFDEDFNLIENSKYPQIFENWLSLSDIIGKKVTLIDSKNNKISAIVTELLYSGGIKLKIDNDERIYYSGDIRIV